MPASENRLRKPIILVAVCWLSNSLPRGLHTAGDEFSRAGQAAGGRSNTRLQTG